MLVEIDGKIIERPISHIEYEDISFFNRNQIAINIPREIPNIQDSERIVWRIGNPIPLIIKVSE